MKHEQAGSYQNVDLTSYILEEAKKGVKVFSFQMTGAGTIDSKSRFEIKAKESGQGASLSFETLEYQELEQPKLITQIGEEFVLPDTIQAKLKDGQTKNVAVAWDEIQPVLLLKKNIFTVLGTVPEYDETVTATVEVIPQQAPEGYQGTVYYLDGSNGSDSQDGTSPETAWKSLEKVNATCFLPGDQILLKSGCIWNGQLWPKGDGAEGKPIRLASYGEGSKPVINGNGTGASFRENANRDPYMQFYSGAVQLIDQSYWEIEDLEVTNNDTNYASNRSGILIYNDGAKGAQKHIYIRRCYVHDCYPSTTTDYTDAAKTTGGINILGEPFNNIGYYENGVLKSRTDYDTAAFEDILAEDNIVRNVAKEGIRNTKGLGNREDESVNKDIVFRNNYIENVFGDGIVICGAKSGGLVENNIVNTFSKSGGNNQYYAGLWAYVCKNTVLQYNEVYNGENSFGDGEAYDVDRQCYDTIVQYNYSHNNFGGFILTMGEQYGTKLRYNISVDDGFGVDRMCGQQQIFDYWNGNGNPSAIPEVYNNTIYIGKDITTQLYYGDKGKIAVNLKNNIIQVDGTLEKVTRKGFTDNYVLENNCLYPKEAFLGEYGWPERKLNSGNNIFENPKLAAPLEAEKNKATAAVDATNGEAPSVFRFRTNIWNWFNLQEDSPCIDAGQEAVGMAQQDILGNTIVGVRDIGAVEYAPEPPVEETEPPETEAPEPPTEQETEETEAPEPPTEQETEVTEPLTETETEVKKPSIEENKPINTEKKLLSSRIKKLKSTVKGVVIQFEEVQEALKYEIYRKTGSSYVKIGETKKNTYLDKKVAASKTMQYFVKPIPKNTSEYQAAEPVKGKAIKLPAAAKIKSVKKHGKSVMIRWKKVKGATAYQILRSEKKKSGYKKVKQVRANTLQYRDRKKLKKKKTYYYKIITVKAGRYSPAGKAKSVRI